jgi:hypothetical protein
MLLQGLLDPLSWTELYSICSDDKENNKILLLLYKYIHVTLHTRAQQHYSITAATVGLEAKGIQATQ